MPYKRCYCNICKYDNDPVSTRVIRQHILKYGKYDYSPSSSPVKKPDSPSELTAVNEPYDSVSRYFTTGSVNNDFQTNKDNRINNLHEVDSDVESGDLDNELVNDEEQCQQGLFSCEDIEFEVHHEDSTDDKTRSEAGQTVPNRSDHELDKVFHVAKKTDQALDVTIEKTQTATYTSPCSSDDVSSDELEDVDSDNDLSDTENEESTTDEPWSFSYDKTIIIIFFRCSCY